MKIGRVVESIKPSLEVRNSNRELAQLVERHPYKVDVAGSNPVLHTKLTKGESYKGSLHLTADRFKKP